MTNEMIDETGGIGKSEPVRMKKRKPITVELDNGETVLLERADMRQILAVWHPSVIYWGLTAKTSVAPKEPTPRPKTIGFADLGKRPPRKALGVQ